MALDLTGERPEQGRQYNRRNGNNRPPHVPLATRFTHAPQVIEVHEIHRVDDAGARSPWGQSEKEDYRQSGQDQQADDG